MAIPSPRYAVNSFTTPHNTTLDDIEQVARTGGHAIGLSEGKLLRGEDDRVAEALAGHGLEVSNAVPAVPALLSMSFDRPDVPKDVQHRADLMCESIERLAKFQPRTVVVTPGASGVAGEPLTGLDKVMRVLPQIADTAAQYGLDLAVEILAARRGSPLCTLPDAVAVLDELARPNTGILLDFFHSWSEPDLHDRLRSYADRIVGVQVCDVKVEERGGFDREYPGQGRAVAPSIMATLIEAGYDGYWELEVFSDDGTYGNAYPDSYWTQPHEQFLRQAKAAFDTAWERALTLVGQRQGVTA